MRIVCGLSKSGSLLLLVALMTLCFAAVVTEGSSTPKYGGTLNVALTASVDTMDPQESVMFPFNRSANFSIWERLVEYVGGEQQHKPMLAESWEFTDPKTLVLHLRQGVKFHDGTTLNAEDVKFTIERLKDPATAAPNAAYAAVIEHVVAVDKNTVRLELSEPYAGILTNLDMIVILSVENPPDPDKPPVGTGPFQYHEWVPGDHLTLKRFPDYWQAGLPYLDEIIFVPIPDEQTRLANLEAGTIDFIPEIAPEQSPRIERNSDLKLIKGIQGSTMLVSIFVLDVPPMDNLLVRRAIAHCLNREAFVESVLYGLGVPTENYYSPENIYYNHDTERGHRYNLERAKELLDEAGYPENFPADAHPLGISIPTGDPLAEPVAVLLQSSLREIGINAQIERSDVPTWYDVRQLQPIFITSYTAGGLDPSLQLSTNLTSQAGNNPKYYNAGLATLIDAGYGEVDLEKRKEIYNAIQALLAWDLPFSVVAAYPTVTAARTWVNDLELMAAESQPIYHRAWLDK